MEKSFVWYPVYKRLPDTNRNVIIQCEGLDEPTIGYFDSATREWVITETELSQELQKGMEPLVIAWMEMPPKYVNAKPLEFRCAAETRYFMSVSASREVNVEITNFYKIRSEIYAAAQKGLGSCEVQVIDMSQNLIMKLQNGGYSIEKNGDFYTISWT